MSLSSRTPRTVLGALVPGVLDPGAATRILSVVRSREAGSLTTWPCGYGQRRRGGPEPSLRWSRGPARWRRTRRPRSHDHRSPNGPGQRKPGSRPSHDRVKPPSCTLPGEQSPTPARGPRARPAGGARHSGPRRAPGTHGCTPDPGPAGARHAPLAAPPGPWPRSAPKASPRPLAAPPWPYPGSRPCTGPWPRPGAEHSGPRHAPGTHGCTPAPGPAGARHAPLAAPRPLAGHRAPATHRSCGPSPRPRIPGPPPALRGEQHPRVRRRRDHHPGAQPQRRDPGAGAGE
ncbi:hypothetical protein Strvi_8293 [Streptomyces violaceusniger Tu 4113]|uniref:Uncharacterized protein n=1 Tax=Streptomyces violaceusniger (strain Tu 4113) TaxID=653045 RepID=G2P0Z1_STRV4|nr:hypothetical protein Strvi_8293 [Streptomyces violaceusniger Tu 4113]